MTGTEPRRPSTRGRLRPVPDPDRQPPHNLEAEEAVLGAVLTAGRLLAEVAGVLEEADFYRPAHRAIWRAMLRLTDRGEPTDPVTVLGELDDSGELADVGGGPFLHTLVEAVPTVAHAGHYAQLVADTARRRRVIDLGIRLAHSDAHPAVLAEVADKLADPTTATHGGHRWEPPVPFGATGSPPTFPVEVLPGWLGEYVAAVATATQTPPDLAGMLALAVLATVAAGAVEVQPRPGWREPLCLFVAVGMDAGTRKSSVFTALTQPVAEFERQQAAAALPAITETATLRRIADQAAGAAEAAASKAPIDQQEERQAEAIARAAEAANLIVPAVPRWLVDDATPEALAGLLATYGRIALLSPEGDVFDQMAGRYNQTAGPNLGVYLKGHAGDLLKVDRRGRPPEYVQRPCLTIGLTVQPEVLQGLASRPGFRGRGLLARFLYSLPPSLVGRRQAGAPPVPEPVADRYTLELQALAASLTRPAGDDPTVLYPRPTSRRAAARLRTRPGAAAGRRKRGPGPPGRLGGQARRRHLPPRRPPAPGRPPPRRLGPTDQPPTPSPPPSDWPTTSSTMPARSSTSWAPTPAPTTPAGCWTGSPGPTRSSSAAATPTWPLLAAASPRPPTSSRPSACSRSTGYLRRVDPEPSRDPHGRGRPASPRFLVNPRHPSTETTESTKTPAGPVSVDSVVSVARGRSPQ